MKRIIGYILLILIFTTLGIIGYLKQPIERPDQEILGTTYYRYNPNTNNYEEFKITNDQIDYKGTEYDISKCSKYEYFKDPGLIKLDCGKSIIISGESKEGLMLEIDKVRTFFYSNKEHSYNYEFQKYFKTPENTYKTSGETALISKKIDLSELKKLIDKKTDSFIYIKTNSCTRECILFNKAFLEFSSEENIYYLDTNELSEEETIEIKNLYSSFPDNQEYPQVVVVGNKEIKEIIKINITGFDLSAYKNYVDKYGENNEENN